MNLSWPDLLLVAALILVNAGVSIALQLGLERRLLLAAIRSVAQLLLLGVVLTWVFRQQGWGAVALLMLFMIVMAGFEAVRRASYRVRGGTRLGLGVMAASSLLVTFYGIVAVLRVDPWYTPQYIVPILGMILGNTLNGISLGLETALEGFRRDRGQVEVLLAHGQTPAEASRDVTRRAVRVGMIPILNSMVAVGIISIPGMMTGQILAGEDPSHAARYQIFILFSIAGAVALGTVGVVFGVRRLVFDERHRLRVERITQR